MTKYSFQFLTKNNSRMTGEYCLVGEGDGSTHSHRTYGIQCTEKYTLQRTHTLGLFTRQKSSSVRSTHGRTVIPDFIFFVFNPDGEHFQPKPGLCGYLLSSVICIGTLAIWIHCFRLFIHCARCAEAVSAIQVLYIRTKISNTAEQPIKSKFIISS